MRENYETGCPHCKVLFSKKRELVLHCHERNDELHINLLNSLASSNPNAAEGYCDICSVSCGSVKAFSQHIGGRKHRRNLKRIMDGEYTSSSSNPSPVISMTSSQPGIELSARIRYPNQIEPQPQSHPPPSFDSSFQVHHPSNSSEFMKVPSFFPPSNANPNHQHQPQQPYYGQFYHNQVPMRPLSEEEGEEEVGKVYHEQTERSQQVSKTDKDEEKQKILKLQERICELEMENEMLRFDGLNVEELEKIHDFEALEKLRKMNWEKMEKMRRLFKSSNDNIIARVYQILTKKMY